MNKIVIIPTYNECENIEAIITAVMNLQNDFHTLIVDDGSPDGTADIVKSFQIQWIVRKIGIHFKNIFVPVF